MGGPCNASITAATSDEMMKKGMDHVRATHPEMVAGIEKMTDAEGDEWNKMFMAKWAAAKSI
jgi:predicted small metal-binding protein